MREVLGLGGRCSEEAIGAAHGQDRLDLVRLEWFAIARLADGDLSDDRLAH